MKHNKEYYDNLITQYIEGKAKIKGQHPQDVIEAVDMFFHAGKMLVDYPEIQHIPAEYVKNLISVLAKHPEYHSLVMDLIVILNAEEGK